jgi:4-amino-4-deoxy-L-arabinose transferase-like glycosyltransferase
LRSFSVAWGVAAVVMVYAISKELFDRKTAVYASVLASLSPFLIQYADEARMYSQYAFFILLATWCFIRFQRSGRWLHALGWGISLGLASLTHYMAFMFAPCFVLMQLIWGEWSFKKIRHLFAGVLAGALMVIFWIPAFVYQLSRSSETLNGLGVVTFSRIFLIVQIFLFGMPRGELSATDLLAGNTFAHISSSLVFWGVGVCFVAMTFFVLIKEQRKALMIVIPSWGFLLLAYALVFLDKPFLYPRYVIPAAYFFCILIAVALRHSSRWMVSGFCIVYGALLLSIVPLQNSQGYGLLKHDLARYRDAHFYSLNTFDYMIAKYYLGGPEYVTLYNVGWPQYDSRSWPGMGLETRRTERFEDIKEDPNALVILNVQLPLERRDDRYFDATPFDLVAKYENIEIYRYREAR